MKSEFWSVAGVFSVAATGFGVAFYGFQATVGQSIVMAILACPALMIALMIVGCVTGFFCWVALLGVGLVGFALVNLGEVNWVGFIRGSAPR